MGVKILVVGGAVQREGAGEQGGALDVIFSARVSLAAVGGEQNVLGIELVVVVVGDLVQQ